ncbi:MAG: molybdopterin cofactor-binding domain-containing protein, partial [Pseudomonadota bacterium]
FVGEAIAIVIAETKQQALDAAEVVVPEIAELRSVSDANVASEPDAPTIWAEVPNNVLVDTEFGDRAATDRAFNSAAHIARASFHVDRVTGVPLEPRAALAHYDADQNHYTLFAGSGGAVRQKAELAHVLGVPACQLRVVSRDVGGNFGTRNRVYPEFALALWASRKVGRPVKYTATRLEAFLSDYQGRDLHTDIELALDSDGRFLAMRAINTSNVGSHCVSLSPLGKGSGLITGSYDIPIAHLRSRAVFTNTVPTQAYRSSGRPEVTFAIERLVEQAARELDIDAVELRRRNMVRDSQMPYLNAVGMRYDSGTYESNLDAALRLIDWNGYDARAEEAQRQGLLLGRGLGHYVESSIGSPKERAEFTVHSGHRISFVIGTQPSGQGHETSFAQVAADLLGVSFETIETIIGDTDQVSVGGGSHSGRSMRHAATVMAKAAEGLLARAKSVAADLWNVADDQVRFDGERFSAEETNYAANILELADGLSAAGRDPAAELQAAADNEMHDPVFPNGCAACEVVVDPDTGEVWITRYVAIDDVGRCINPMIVHGQTHGGIAQGVGQALLELCPIDPDSGQPLAGSFMDYGMPRADTFPFFKSEIVEVLSPTNPLGIKAGGEGGTTPALAVIVNAVCHALRDYNVHDIKMPLTSYRVWQAIQDAKARKDIAP